MKDKSDIQPENIAESANNNEEEKEESLSLVKSEASEPVEIKRAAVSKKNSNANKINFSQSQLIAIAIFAALFLVDCCLNQT